MFFSVGTDSKRLDNLGKRFNKKRQSVKQERIQECQIFYRILFLQWLKLFVLIQRSKSHFSVRKNDLDTNGCENDETGSSYNSDFGDDQDREGEFSIMWTMNKSIFIN